jgi:hypothetical protein
MSQGDHHEQSRTTHRKGASRAERVRDGIDTPNEAVPNLERHFAVGENHHKDGGAAEDTPAQKILKGADLSDRLFNSSAGSTVRTGSPITPK